MGEYRKKDIKNHYEISMNIEKLSSLKPQFINNYFLINQAKYLQSRSKIVFYKEIGLKFNIFSLQKINLNN